MKYLEDYRVGQRSSFGRYEVTREEVLEFAAKYDPQPFHLDDEAAAQTYFGRVSASGWHTCAMTMRMLVGNITREKSAGLGSPVYPGDTLRVEGEVIEVRPSQSRPEMGSTKNRLTVFNQHDEPVMTMISIGLVRRRPD
jgi:acyl dehydratase